MHLVRCDTWILNLDRVTDIEDRPMARPPLCIVTFAAPALGYGIGDSGIAARTIHLAGEARETLLAWCGHHQMWQP